MLNYADGLLFGWQFWLAVIATVAAFWYVMRMSRKHDATRPPRSPRSYVAQRTPPQRPTGRRP
jgi:hypothetical protein